MLAGFALGLGSFFLGYMLTYERTQGRFLTMWFAGNIGIIFAPIFFGDHTWWIFCWFVGYAIGINKVFHDTYPSKKENSKKESKKK